MLVHPVKAILSRYTIERAVKAEALELVPMVAVINDDERPRADFRKRQRMRIRCLCGFWCLFSCLSEWVVTEEYSNL